MKNLLYKLQSAKNNFNKIFAILIDPDKEISHNKSYINEQINSSNADLIMVGGSLLSQLNTDRCIHQIRNITNLPIYLFPGSPIQYSNLADGILFLSLISGRNADLLIGRHVEIAPTLMQSNLEVIATGYMLIDGGKPTSATYISNSFPIPADKHDIAVATAQAAELLGLKCIYLDAGSGAINAIDKKMIHAVAKAISIPLIVGGGIKTKEQVQLAYDAGADMVVVGTAFENKSYR